jgi:hypothetical protein
MGFELSKKIPPNRPSNLEKPAVNNGCTKNL